MQGHKTAQDAANRGSLNAETEYLHHSENIVEEGKKEYKNQKVSIGHTEHHLLNMKQSFQSRNHCSCSCLYRDGPVKSQLWMWKGVKRPLHIELTTPVRF